MLVLIDRAVLYFCFGWILCEIVIRTSKNMRTKK